VTPMTTESAQRDRRRMASHMPIVAGWSMAALLVLAGCSHGPEYSIFGSFFPAWIFCSAGGLLLAACARALIARTAIAEHLAAPVLFYLSTAIFLACILWLLFYS
jgi:YtcA family